MKIFELLASIFTASMHLTAIIACVIRKDPWGWMFVILALASLIWVYVAVTRLKEKGMKREGFFQKGGFVKQDDTAPCSYGVGVASLKVEPKCNCKAYVYANDPSGGLMWADSWICPAHGYKKR